MHCYQAPLIKNLVISLNPSMARIAASRNKLPAQEGFTEKSFDSFARLSTSKV